MMYGIRGLWSVKHAGSCRRRVDVRNNCIGGTHMTLQELYQIIEGDYDQAIRVLRMEKLVDKHIRKFTSNGVVEGLLAAEKTMDPTELFEKAHAVKGVCSNLGLTKLADAASLIADEYRPGKARSMSDDEVKEKLRFIGELYEKTVAGIQRYEGN